LTAAPSSNRAIVDARDNLSPGAKLLGLSRQQLCVRLRQHGLEWLADPAAAYR